MNFLILEKEKLIPTYDGDLLFKVKATLMNCSFLFVYYYYYYFFHPLLLSFIYLLYNFLSVFKDFFSSLFLQL
jgi:hypothetical protein